MCRPDDTEAYWEQVTREEEELINSLEPEELENFNKGIGKKVGDEIYVNDFGIARIVGKSDIHAHLVVEEDGSVRWYVNPNDRSDFVIRSVPVVFVEER